MKIKYIQGDLFQTDIKHIMHGCNDQGVMGSGVAKIVRELHPAAYKHYLDQDLELGKVFYVPSNDKIIINAVTQHRYGKDGRKYVSYDAVDLIMKKVNYTLMLDDYKEVAMPKIGSTLGGGNWNIIEKIIEENMKLVQAVVYYIE